MRFRRGDPVVFYWAYRWREDARIVGIYTEYRGILRVEWKGLEYTVMPDDVRTLEEHEKWLGEARKQKAIDEYSDLMAAWDAGKRTNQELATATNTPMRGIASRIRAAKKKGLLT